MKSLIACLAAAFTLSGCIAVPYYGYGEPAPAYGYYGAPAGGVYFNYSYRGGPGYYRHRY